MLAKSSKDWRGNLVVLKWAMKKIRTWQRFVLSLELEHEQSFPGKSEKLKQTIQLEEKLFSFRLDHQTSSEKKSFHTSPWLLMLCHNFYINHSLIKFCITYFVTLFSSSGTIFFIYFFLVESHEPLKYIIFFVWCEKWKFESDESKLMKLHRDIVILYASNQLMLLLFCSTEI